MKTSRLDLASIIAKTTLKNGVNKRLAKGIAALLLTENRVSEIEPLLRDVQQDWADSGTVEVIAVCAHPLSAKNREEIKAAIKKGHQSVKKIIISEKLDSTVMAGIRLELANSQLDLSADTKLKKFKQLATT